MKDEKFLTCLGALALVVGALVVGIPMSGWALSVLWGWFVVPVFNVPNLSIAQAVGLSCIVSFFKSYKTGEPDKDKSWVDVAVGLIVSALLAPLLAVGFGWIVHLFLAH